MRGLKAVVLIVAAFVLAVGLLAACSGAGDGGNNDANGGIVAGGSSADSGSADSGSTDSGSTDSGSTDSGSTDSGSGGGMVTGTVTWHDQNPAANASVYFANADSGFSGNGWSPEVDSHGNFNGSFYYQVSRLPADGTYSLPGCPCSALTAFLYVPATYGADPANGGRDCWIIMQDDSGNYSGLQASPGGVVNWHALDMNCSQLPYPTDSSTVQSEYTLTDPSANGGDYSQYAGTWQAAESRTSGGGSSS